jgi:hypothetical protein
MHLEVLVNQIGITIEIKAHVFLSEAHSCRPESVSCDSTRHCRLISQCFTFRYCIILSEVIGYFSRDTHTPHTRSAIQAPSSNYPFYMSSPTASVVKWSEFLAAKPEVPGSIPGGYQIFLVAVGLELGPLSPCEDKWRAAWKKSNGSGLENHAKPLYPQKLALNFVDKWRLLSRYSSLTD